MKKAARYAGGMASIIIVSCVGCGGENLNPGAPGNSGKPGNASSAASPHSPPGNSSSSESSTSAPTVSEACSIIPSAELVNTNGALLSQAPIQNDSANESEGGSAQFEFEIETHGRTVRVEAEPSSSGATETYLIDFGDGTLIDHHSAWHTYLLPGDYNITVTSSNGLSKSAVSKPVKIVPNDTSPDNHAPIAFANQTSGYNRTSANAVISYDQDGDELTYNWTVIDEQCGRQRVAGPEFSSAFSPSFVLTVTDGKLGDTVQGRLPALTSGVVDVADNPQIFHRRDGLTVHVEPRRSIQLNNLSWDFGDGSSSETPVASHTYAEPGTYDISLTAGIYHLQTQAIRVEVGSDNTAPQASFSCALPTEEDPYTNCSFSETPDQEGDFLRLTWDMGDGTVYEHTWNSAASNLVSHIYKDPGTYTISVTADDGELQGSHSLKWNTASGPLAD